MKFLEKTAEHLWQRHKQDMSRVLVLTPNQRSCTYLTNELKNRASKSLIAPEMATLQNRMIAQSPWVQADEIELLADLYGCHQQIGGKKTIDEFLTIGQTMLRDFDELDTQLTDTKSFFKNLELLKSMNVYTPGKELTTYQIQYRQFWKEFGQLYQLLRDTLAAKQKGYRGMLLRQVAESEELLAPLKNYAAVYLVGFSGLNKSDELVIAYLKRETKAEILCDADSYYVNHPLHEAGYFFRKYQKLLDIDEAQWSNTIRTQKKSVEIIGTAKNMGQVQVVADILKNRLHLHEQTATETVVVVPDEKLLIPLLVHLPQEVHALNITMGVSVVGSHIGQWIDAIFRLAENSRHSRTSPDEKRFYYKDVLTLLQHSFVALLTKPTRKTEAFCLMVKKNNRIAVSLAEIREQTGADVAALFFSSTSASEYVLWLHRHVSSLLHCLLQAVRRGKKNLSVDAEIAYRVLQFVAGVKKLTDVQPAMSAATAIAMLREAIRRERIPVEGDPVEGLQIMGLQETRSLDFKNVIVLSANEGILPSGKSKNTFIPNELRQKFLFTHTERDAVTGYLFYRLFHHAENVFLLYNTEPDELGGGDKSRYLLQLQQEMSGANVTVEEKVFAINPPAALPEPDIVVEKSEAVMQKLFHLLGTSGISPSALNTYINCSLQYYFRYIANIREQEDIEESMEASTIGSAVHYALEMFFRPQLDKPLSASFIEERLKDKGIVERLIKEHLKDRFDEESLRHGKNLLLYRVCVQLVEQFLSFEKEQLQQLAANQSSLQLIGLEEQWKHTVQVRGQNVWVGGRTDRVERVDELVQIADYKTSKKSTIPILSDAVWDTLMTDPKYAKPVQLLIYAWLYYKMNGEKDIPLRSGIYWLRDAVSSLDLLSVAKEDYIIRKEQLAIFEEKLIQKLEELTDVHIPFTKTEDRKRCRYCEFAKVCGREQ